MRLSKKLLSVLVVPLVIGASGIKVYAEGEEGETVQHYPYDVVIYEGDQPGFASAESPVRITVDPGTQLDIKFSEAADGYELKVGETTIGVALPETVTADGQTENIYTPIGIKETGTDNAEVIVSLTGDSAKINEDKAYVLTYGVTGTLVDYTVIYRTNTGAELGRANYKARVGDKPVVAALQFDGYVPDANNRTRTLTSDPAANVFTFTYHPVGTAGAGTTTTEEEYEYITLADGTVTAVPAAGGGGGGNGGNAGGGGDGAAPAAPAAQEDTPETVELIDEDVPLAGPTETQTATPAPVIEEIDDSKPPLSGWLLGGTITFSLAILIFFLILLFRRRKNIEE